MEDRAPREDGRLYDHEDRGDIRGGSGDRRRGPIADWGGDELFGSRPARRSRPGAPSQAAPPTQGHGVAPHATAARPRQPHPAGHPHAHPAGPGRGWAPVEIREQEPGDRHAAGPASAPDGLEASAPASPGRRTVVIGGRPGGRPRSRRAVPDHLGARPDHAAAWAVGLGLLLILVAILTAGI